MNVKEFRLYILIVLIFMLFFMDSLDKIHKMNKSIEDMREELANMPIVLNYNDELYAQLEEFKQKQDLYLETQDWQITDVNESLVLLSEKVENISQMRVILSNEEIGLLEEVVMAESGGESLECQKAVASVVINRMLHDRFPKTLDGVIYQKNAFSVTFDGSLGKREVTQKVKDAVKLALYEDYAKDALYFLNVDLAIAQGYGKNARNMIESYEEVLKIDNVTFLKGE